MRITMAFTARIALLAALVGAVSGPVGSGHAEGPARTAAPTAAPLAVATSSTPKVDGQGSVRLRDAADRARRGARRDPLFRRSAYMRNATRIATAAMNRDAVRPPGDDAPMAYVGGVTTEHGYAASLGTAIAGVVDSAHAVLAYPMHTDGGWSVVVKRMADGRIAYGVALVVGWPTPAVSRRTGCATGGYCWTNSGLNPHLPWTRNTVKWYLSTSNLPAAGEALTRRAIARLNAVRGVGAHLVYGGRTTATGPTSTRRFVVVFGSGCSTANALGCTITSSQGPYRLIFQAKSIITLSRYRANPDPEWWLGTLMHEIAHGTGLGHYDSRYGGSYQLMRSANGPDVLRGGDANGLRRLAPGGAVTGSIRARRSLTGRYTLVVRTANSGLGGIRSVRTQCTDAAGTYRTVASISGRYDTRPANRVVGSIAPPRGATRSCRAIIRSKTRSFTTARITVRG